MDLPTTHYDESIAAPARTAETRVEAKKGGILTKISFYLILIAAFLAPIFFIPSAFAPLEVIKAFFLGFTVLTAALLYAIDAVKHKTLALPRSILGYSAILIALSTILSSLFSGNIAKTFLGQGFEITSASFILLMILASYLVSRIVIKDRETVLKIYSAIFIAFILLALFHIARFFAGPSFLSFGLLQSVTATLAGKWYDFAALTGVIGFLSLIGIKFLPLRGSLKTVLYVVLVVSGLLLFVVNSSFLWAIVAVVALALAGFEFSVATPKGTGAKGAFSRISILTAIIFIIAVVCATKGTAIAGPVVEKFKAQYGELILPWQMTLDITSNTLKESPILGAGPNRFGFQYLQHKPTLINQTPFWNAEFTSGFGLLPSFVVTQGILGGLVWILFLAFFIREGARALKRVTDPLKRFFVASSFFASLFLLIIDLVYVPSHTTIFLTAIFVGVFVALLVSEGVIAEKNVSVRQGGKMGVVPVLVYLAVIVLAVWLGAYVKKAIAITHFQKGIHVLSTTKSAENAESQFRKALSWDASDVYYQALSETNILKINTLAQEIQKEAQGGATPDQKKSDALIALITDSLKYTKTAQGIDPQNYYNYLAEARISEIGTSLKIPNAYENARAAYANAIIANPSNPALFLNLARLEASQNKLQDAEQYIGRALQLKPNYTEAVFLLSQIQVANNQLSDAMVSTQVAIQLNPNEPLLYFQYGLLSYTGKDYTTAIAALEKAVSLNSQYANARYFLGLSYARLGRNADAIAQFEELSKTNPDSQEVVFILENLKEGKSPFADAQPPIDNTPEKRKTLPVTEKADPKPATSATKTPTKKP